MVKMEDEAHAYVAGWQRLWFRGAEQQEFGSLGYGLEQWDLS